MADLERTFVMVKPDGVQRGLVGEVVSRFEQRGLKLVGGTFMRIDEDLAGEHYAEHVDEPFFEELTDFIRRTCATASAPSHTIANTGPEVMKSVSSSKNGSSTCSA